MQTRSHFHARDGIALVMVLAFIVLLTILIVSFIAFERLNRVSTASYSKSIQAEEIAQGGIQDILGDLHSEIIAGSMVYNTNASGVAYTNSYAAAYIPVANLTAVPARIGYPNSSYGTDTSATTLSPTLVRVSRATGNPNAAGGDSFFTNLVASVGNYTNGIASVPGNTILNRASLASTTNVFNGGRYVSAARWNKSYLLATNSASVPLPFTAAPPDWVYVTRTGSRVCATSELPSLKPSTTLAANYGAVAAGSNPPASPVVGRYAFVMYDEGALLDANVAGYTHSSTNLVSSPADPTTGITQAVNGKSYLAYSDLTQLPGLSGNQSTVDNFVNWRNAGGIASMTSGTAGDNYLLALISYSKNGFLNFQAGDSPLLSRQDLINYFASIDSNINTTTAKYSKALPYLGTFSRAVSAPSWTPTADSLNMPNYITGLGTSVAYKTNAEKNGPANRDLANVRFAVAGTVTHYFDNQSSTTPTSTYAVNIGDPLLQNRFSLARINWLSSHTLGGADPGTGANPVTGAAPSATTAAPYAAAIQACFGLVWGSPGSTTTNSSTSTSTANGGNPCWNYVGSPAGTGGTLAAFNGTIETLDQVAKEAREPNFFELLKAAILSGSVGLGGGPASFQNGNPAIGGIIVNGVNKFGGSNIPYDFTDEPGQYWQYRAGVGGLFSYSLGYARMTTGPFGPAQFPDVQIIQIGANIIDQFDADSYPTAIYFPYGNYTTPSGQTYTGMWHSTLDPVYGNGTAVSSSGPCALFGPLSMVYGEENLPLLHRIYGTVASPNRTSTSEPPQTSDNDVHTLEGWLQPQLWNPHQQTTKTPANSPVNFEIRAYGSAATYCDESNVPLADPANPPPGWSNYPLNPPTAAWQFEQSSFVTYYPGASSTEDPTILSANGGGREGTLTFTIDPSKFPFCDTPRLLTVDNLPGVTVDTTQGLPQTPTSPSTEPESNYTQTTFPGYATAQYNGNPAYPTGFTNHFAAFSTGDITGTYNGNLTPSPYNAYFVNQSQTRGAPAFYAAASYPSNGVSFVLGWYPAGQSPTASNFHPYSFITGIFATAGMRMWAGANSVVGYVQTNNVLSPLDWGSLDPRTSRFSNTFGCEVSEATYNYNEPGNNTIFGKNDQYAAFTTAGVPYNGNFVTSITYDGSSSGVMNNYQALIQGWISNVTSPLLAIVKPAHSIPTFYPASASQRTTTPVTTPAAYAVPEDTPDYYADPDGVVRPADGAYPTPGTGDGVMTFVNDGTPQANGNAVSATDKTGSAFPNGVQHGRRPVILNRPFRSVGELGYVFRDEPFKTLDMFSKSSADGALLDVFSLTDESTIANSQIGSVVAGQFNPSNAPVPVIQAVLAGGSKKDADATYNVSTEAKTIAQNCVNALNPTGAAPNPLMNRAALATQLMPAALTAMRATTSFDSGDMSNKTYFEAPIRALADVTNTRTWNLLIDIIAQSGQMSPTAATLNDFVVQGERRYWLHIAIDRYTGKIIDQQLEPVYE